MESSPSPSSPAPHVVLLPFPSVGHVNPFLLIARLLANRGICCTVFLAHDIYNKVVKEEAASSFNGGSTAQIQYAVVSEGLLPAGNTQGGSEGFSGNESLPAFAAAFDLMLGMKRGVEDVLKKLPSPPRCLIADSFVVWSHELAQNFGFPRILFYTSNAFSWDVVVHLPMLYAKGLVPFTDASYCDPQYVVDCIPGIPPLRPIDFSESTRKNFEFVLQMALPLEKDEAFLLNTVYELEKDPLDVLREMKPVYPIGPLFVLCDERSANTVNLWTEQIDCLTWLDAQPSSSVLYVSFGSMGAMPAAQLMQLAEGLESSQQRFLWVIRPDAVLPSETESLPKGFAERAKDRGLIISWAPQLQVLAHPSLGGFLSHCGWNSTIENVSKGGLPMICWPLGAEQRLNCRLIVDVWKIGIEFPENMNGIVGKGDVERTVRALIEGEEGRTMTIRARQLKEVVNRAVEEGGSSFRNFEAFVESIKGKPRQAD